jgi:hypothetical protein
MSHQTANAERNMIMNKQDRLTLVVLALLCIILLWGGISARDRLRSLENQIRDLQVASSSNGLYSEIANLRQSLKEEIEKGASIVSSSEATVSFEDGAFDVRLTVIPKTISQGEEIYLSLGDQRVQATSVNGMAYAASFSVPPAESIQPFISIERDGGRRQEGLAEVSFRDYLSLGVDSRMEHESNTLDIQVFAFNEESSTVLSRLDSVELVVYDRTKRELERLPFLTGESGYVNEDGHQVKPDGKINPYHLIIPDRFYEQGDFNASVVMTAGDVTLYSEEVYSYTKQGTVLESIGGGQFNISFGD